MPHDSVAAATREGEGGVVPENADAKLSFRERVLSQTEQRTPLMDKMAALTDEEWDELTWRLKKHLHREMEARGIVMVKRD